MSHYQKYISLAGTGGILAGAALNGWLYWWFVFVSAFLLGWLFWRAPSLRLVVWVGVVFGTSKALLVLTWGFATYPLSWLGDFPAHVVLGLLVGYWLLAAVSIGLGTALVLGLLYQFKAGRWSITLLIIGLTISESLGALLYSLVFSGPGSGPQMYFSFGFLGYALTESSILLPLAQYGGVYALSLFVYSSSVLVAYALHTKQYQYALAATGLFVILVFIPPVTSWQSGEAMIVDTAITAESLDSRAGQAIKAASLRNAVAQAISIGGSHIVLPEDSRLYQQFNSLDQMQDWLRDQSAGQEVYVYDSGRESLAVNGAILRGYVLGSEFARPLIFDKSYLVPQGEFVPYFAYPITQLLLSSDRREDLLAHLAYRRSWRTEYQSYTAVGGFLFCFEAVNPLGVLQSRKRVETSFIVHPVSHSWFYPSPRSLRHQLEAMLRAQAVWQQTPIVVAGNLFDGFVVTPDGTVVPGQVVRTGDGWRLRSVQW